MNEYELDSLNFFKSEDREKIKHALDFRYTSHKKLLNPDLAYKITEGIIKNQFKGAYVELLFKEIKKEPNLAGVAIKCAFDNIENVNANGFFVFLTYFIRKKNYEKRLEEYKLSILKDRYRSDKYSNLNLFQKIILQENKVRNYQQIFVVFNNKIQKSIKDNLVAFYIQNKVEDFNKAINS